MIRFSLRSTFFPYTTLFRSLQRRLPPERAALHRRVGADRQANRALGRLRARLQDNGPQLHGDRVVGLQRSEEHTSELQSRRDLVCRLLLEKKKYVIY